MRDTWSLPPRSWLQTVLVTGLTAIRLAIVAVLVLLVLGPMLLDLARVKRGSPAVNVMYDGRTYVRQTAGAEIAKYIPTTFAGKDRTDWVLLVGLPCSRARRLDPHAHRLGDGPARAAQECREMASRVESARAVEDRRGA
jgi:hypothetical protein